MTRSRLWSRHVLIPCHQHRRPWLHTGTLRKRLYTNPAKDVLVHIPKCNIYRFGDSNIALPVFRDVNWTIKEGQNWVVIGRGSNQKTALLQTLCGHMRIAPPPPAPGGLFPFLSDPPRDAHASISLVSFAHRPSLVGSAFYDYTARYGAVREEDRITLRESMFGEYDFLNLRPKRQVSKTPEELALDKTKKGIFDELSAKLGLSSLLDLPLVALSNGQTRRARIVRAILAQPELLLLDEPLTGLDVNSRPTLLSVLRSLHEARRPRVIISLRVQDPIPDWITHLALVSDDKVLTGTKEEILATQELHTAKHDKTISVSATTSAERTEDKGKPVVVLRNVSVSYGERKVLKSINWTIREGQRWHLQGANGSGKTTLLSLLTGDHLQSYTQRGDARLDLFARPRPRIPTPHLRALIGVVSPELANAYPRHAQTTVWDVVGTGFDGAFVPGGEDGVGRGVDGALSDAVRRWRVARVWEVLAGLGPRAWAAASGGETERDKDEEQTQTRRYAPWPRTGDAAVVADAEEAFARRAFVDLSPGEQSVVLLMRALVGRPQLVLLDEVWAGMDDRMVRAAQRYLRGGSVGQDQAVVVVSHWEEEVPWTTKDGLYRFRLQDGVGMQT